MNRKSVAATIHTLITTQKSFRSYLLIAIVVLFLAGMMSRNFHSPVYAAGTITGTVYKDYNANGAMNTTGATPNFAIDAGVAGVVVTAYDGAGVVRGTATTGASGTYSLAAAGTGPYRIEFTALPSGYYPSVTGTNNASTVRFVPDGNSSGIDLGILKPTDYSQNNPLVATPCYINGNNTGADDVLVALAYDRSGAVQHIALSNQIGSTWGLAWRPRTKTLFAAAMLKRQTGFGPGKDGTRGTADDISSIYVIDYNAPGANGAGTVVTAQTIDMNSFSGVNVGANPRVGSTPANDLAGNTTPAHDYNVLDKVGRRGIGGIAVSEDGNTLYVVNLNLTQPQLIALNITNLSSITLNSITNISNPGCPGTDTFAPWAVRVKDGEVYVGTVCTADVSQNAQNLRAYVQRLSGSSFTNVDLDSTIAADYMQLYYDRSCKYYNTGGARCDRAEWTPWDDNFTFATIGTQRQVTGVQPILSDIEFDPDGAMILGVMDRRGHQHGTGNYSPTAGDTALYEEISAGTILKLCNVSGTYVPEGKAGCSRTVVPPYDATTDPAPGAAGIPTTFFNNYSATGGGDGHEEIFFGGLANLPGAKEIVGTMMNPQPTYYAGGWRWLSTATGAPIANFTLYTGNGGTSNVLGKANGLGDTVLLTDPAPLQIGNRVWNDADGDGIQDANESAISGVTVQLWGDTNGDGTVDTQVGSATTDASGNYYFGGSSNTNMLSSCGTTTLTPRVNASSDDAEEAAGTVVTTGSLDLAYAGSTINLVGMRFNGLTIPRGARITSATLQFTASNSDSTNTVNLTIQGEAVANSTTFTTATNNLSSRPRTTSSVAWSALGAWTSGATTNATSPNFAAVIQEIVNNSGWASGNSLNLFLSDNASTASARRRGRSFDSSTTTAPLLSVTYDCPYTLATNRAYEIRIATGQASLSATPALTTTNGDASANGDSRDSDVTLSGSNAVIAFTSGGAGVNDHTFDAGFLPTASAIYSLGNRVFFDTNNNGQMDVGEIGIGNVTVQLLDSNNTVVQTQTTTTTAGSAGYYRFDNLVAGTYKVRIPAANFTGAGALVGYQNSANSISGTDLRDNGVDPASNNPSTAGVLSASLVVGNGAFPISEPDVTASGAGAHAAIGDGRDNLTVDFGFFNVVLGNLIFVDANSNGTFDGIDTPLSGATVRLYQADGTTEVPVGPDGILGTTDDTTGVTNQLTTTSTGLYQFSGLPAGSYVVKVNPGSGYRSTADVVNTGNPNSNTDSDDNGVGSATGQVSSAVNASAIALTPGSEPTVDNNTGKTTNFTLDFGFNSVTAVTLTACVVSGYDKGALIEWQSGFEEDNLGYNIYQEDNGKRTLVNQQMIAGSALTVGTDTVIRSGFSYAWWDDTATGKTAAYWLEAVDLNGTSQWFGPYFVNPIGGAPPPRSNAPLLSKLGAPQQQITRPVEAMAGMPRSSAKPVDKQPYLALAGAAIKIGVKEEGWYRIPFADLQSAGLPANTNPQFLQLFVDGQELPIKISEDKDGKAVEFYGVCVNSLYTFMRTYYLVPGTRQGLRIESVEGKGVPSNATGFAYSVERKDRTIYFSSLRNGDRENFFGAVISRNPLNQTVTLTNLDPSATGYATLDVSVQGVTQVNHVILVQLNGASLGYVSFAGLTLGAQQFHVPQSVLREGQNTVTLTPLGGNADIDLVDAIRLTYQHRYKVDNNLLKFTASGGQRITVDGFSSPAIEVLDVTNPFAISEMTLETQAASGGGYAASFVAPASGERTLLALTVDKKKAVPSLKRDDLTTWKQTNNAADLVIITTREFAPVVADLKALRETQGLTVVVLCAEDLYDEFSYGQKNPQAIRDFLNFTAKWKKGPRYVLLVGDASYDPKNYLGAGDFDFVPSKLIDTHYMETASDDWLADFDGDGIADLNIGRLPVRTVEQAKLMIAKIIAYEKATPSREVLLVADAPDIYDFESATDALRTLVDNQTQISQIKRAKLDASTAKSQLLAALNRGPRVVNYVGHGSVNLWRGNLLTNADARALTNSERLSFVVVMSCLNGYFNDPYLDGLAESLMKAEGGGAVAVWASSGLTEPHEQSVMNQELYRQLFNPKIKGSKPTISEAIRKAKAVVLDMDIRRSWIFFGDPTMKLK
ncbi:MAG: hypothetical protein HY231_03400 [Acidobacteria bacterium]|nr:hypothetical protein [Acidobacteriota bacterium]